MNKLELKRKVKDLSKALNKYMELVKGSEKDINLIIGIAEMFPLIKEELGKKESVREIKRRKLTDEFIKTLDIFDIHEALNIDMKEAEKKLNNFDFTTKEKNIILNKFPGNALIFLKKYNEK